MPDDSSEHATLSAATGNQISDPARPQQQGLLLPSTALWILALDWLLFSSNAMALGLATPISVGLGFVLGGIGTLFLQKRFAGDPWWKAMVKALGAGLVTGAPWPVGGTLIGGWILLAAGLRGTASDDSPST